MNQNLQQIYADRFKVFDGNAANWTLAEDSKLCTLLSDLSDSLASHVKDASDAVECAASAATRASVRVSNLNNRLSSFSNDQFIESRVYDETFHASAAVEVPKEKSISECQDETLENMRQAVALGFDVIKKQFKRIEMRPEDFDEDDDPTFVPEPVFEPFDSHLSRPLPFVIGTTEWTASPSAGIYEAPDIAVKEAEEKEVVIGLPNFVQPRIGGQPVDMNALSDAKRQPLGRAVKQDFVENASNAVGSVQSTKSDHSGLFPDYSPDQESVTSDDIFAVPSKQNPKKVEVEQCISSGSLSASRDQQRFVGKEVSHSEQQEVLPPLPEQGLSNHSEMGISTACHSAVPILPSQLASVTSTLPSASTTYVNVYSPHPVFTEKTAFSAHDESSTAPETANHLNSRIFLDSKNSLFGSSDSDDDIFSDVRVRKKESTMVPKIESDSAQGPSLLSTASPDKLQDAVDPSTNSVRPPSKNIFDNDSDDGDLFTDFRVHDSMPSGKDFAQKTQPMSEKAVFRTGGRVSADFANRLSGLIVAPPKQLSSPGSVMGKSITERQPSSSSLDSSSSELTKIVAQEEEPKMRVETNSNSGATDFRARLSAILMAKPSNSVPESNGYASGEPSGAVEPPQLKSVVKTRTKGPYRRAPTRPKRQETAAAEVGKGLKAEGDNAVADAAVKPDLVGSSVKVNVSVSKELESKQNPTDTESVEVPKQSSGSEEVQRKQETSLFSDSDSDDDMFSSISSKPMGVKEKLLESMPSPSAVRIGVHASVPADKNLNAAEVSDHSKKTIFSTNSDDDDDLFASNTSQKVSLTIKKDTPVSQSLDPAVTNKTSALLISSRIKTSGIFGDDSDSDTDLFR